MSLDQLIDVEVTSASRNPERLAATAAAVTVITQDDLRRHGIRSIPEALRLAPGMTSLQIAGNQWAVGSRGFTDRFANKLMVLMDGRLLYTTSYSGVYWDMQDTLLEDIERIEVIRGPGAALWGANAVNGVINIITRRADVEPGLLVSTRVEEDGGYLAAVRATGSIRDVTVRGFLRHEESRANETLAGGPSGDHWHLTRAGLRADGSRGAAGWSLISEVYSGHTDLLTENWSPGTPGLLAETYDETDLSGGFANLQWTRRGRGGESSVQATLDTSDRDAGQYREQRRSAGLELQQRLIRGRHDLLGGLSTRIDRLDVRSSAKIMAPPRLRSDMLALFLRDDYALVPERVTLSAGVRVEYNSLSGRSLETLPTLRLGWQVAPRAFAWTSLSRAVRTPSQAERVIRVADLVDPLPAGAAGNPFPLPMRFEGRGNPAFAPEKLTAWQAGLRGAVGDATRYDVAVFVQRYDDVRAFAPGRPVCAPGGIDVLANPLCLAGAGTVVTPIVLANGGRGSVNGAEVSIDHDVTPRWRLRASYSLADERIDAFGSRLPATGPRDQAGLRSEWTPGAALNLALFARYVDDIPAWGLPDYWQLDAQANWAPAAGWQIGVGARNLLGTRRVQYVSLLNDLQPTIIERSYFLQLRHSH
jgi:iron complex outermembrane recepter protein